jgi:S-adenosylmethionine:tRNA ribosyltransferase-isomerase
MKINELNYTLPAELIAQEPLNDRDKACLLVLHKNTGKIEHRLFCEISAYFKKGDMLILNNTKVIPARLIAKKPTGGKLEILLIKEKKFTERETVWQIMTKGSYEGQVIFDDFTAEIRRNIDGVELVFKGMNSENVKNFIHNKGFMPLPPYIKRNPVDRDRIDYQTVYAKINGSIAAPTAGLHFTKDLLEIIINRGIIVKEITLHVGVGTFKTIKTENIENHKMDSEYFEIDREILEEIQKTKKNLRKVFLVGTTTTRALEGYASGRYTDTGSDDQKIRGWTDIFIYPGYKFKIADALITNFHLPKSTPLALVYAFCGTDKVKNAYKEAIKKGYRFFSYGDAMLII